MNYFCELNPIERIEVLAKARILAFFIHGNVDKAIPLKENSSEFVSRYQTAEINDDIISVPLELAVNRSLITS